MSTVATTLQFGTGLIPGIDRPMGVLTLIPGQTKRASLRHEVLALDCSGSMYGSLHEVVDHTRQYVDSCDDSHYVSVIVFSGHNRSRLIVGPTRCDVSGKSLIGKALDGVGIMDLTVFSEPLELTLEHLKSVSIDDMAHQAILFTDGCAVPTKWGVGEEHRRAFAAAKALYDFGAIVSAVGYGYYYDQDFINELMVAGGSSGIFRHMSNVDDFGEVIEDISDAFDRLDQTEITLEVNLGGSVSLMGAYRTLPQVQKLHADGNTITVRGAYDGSLTCFFDLSQDAKSAEVVATINGNTESFQLKVKPLDNDEKIDCFAVAISNMVNEGANAEAAEVLTSVGEEGAAERVLNSYTERDRRGNADIFRSTFRDPGKRFIGAGLRPSGPNHCVLNVLRVLLEDPALIMSIPQGAYKRGGKQSVDPRVVRSPLGSTVDVVSYTSHKDRFNFSITTKVAVEVLPADDDGNIVPGSPTKANVFRTYNLVRDGELVMEELLASMSENSFDQLQEAGVIDADKVYEAGKSYVLRLGDLPMVSSAWARPTGLKLVDLLKEIKEYEAEQTALNKRISTIGKPEKPEFDGEMYIEKATKELPTVETYEAPTAVVGIMGYKASYVDDTAGLSFDEADARVKLVRQRLRSLRFIARCIVFACHITGWTAVSWSAPKTNRFGKEERRTTLGGAELKLTTAVTEVEAA